ncbi:CHAD domain-containing protein [Aquiflexum lacus]|uniref:CHAD domain-containing protein n=1 Tax=Aquiflexum lacus TaxID=2483805 RepID=UPI001893DD9E|nr:CHAD domain-containing protein [Aquiflexum lacus]
MNKRQQKEFLEDKWKMLHQHFDQFCQHQNPVDIHQMRVFTKKIHSFVKYCSHILPNTDLVKVFKPVRKIFKHAGIIREAQIHLLNFEKIGLTNEKLENKLKNLIQKETRNFILQEKKYGKLLQKAEEDFYKQLIPISNSQSKRFFKDYILASELILNKKRYIPHLHDSRKYLKSIHHITELTGKEVGKKNEINITYLGGLTEKIGNWHDLHQTQLWLKGKKMDSISKKALTQNIEDILLQIDSSKDNFKEKILIVSSTSHQVAQEQ